VPIVRNANWRTVVPTSLKVGDGVRPRFGVTGLAQTAYAQPLGIGGTAMVMQHGGPNAKVFAAMLYQEDP
jgi:hypothetical protein